MIRMQDLKALARNTCILALDEAGQLYVRMSGTELDTMFGKNLSGVSITEITTPEACEGFTHFHKALIQRPCAGFAHDVITDNKGHRLNCRFLILPLVSDSGDKLYCMSYCDLEREGYNLETQNLMTTIDYREFKQAYFLDLGFGMPNFSY